MYDAAWAITLSGFAGSRLAKDLGLPFPILSDPRLVVVRAFAMYGDSMGMPDMGYGSSTGRDVSAPGKWTGEFGDNAESIVRAVRDAKRQV